MGFDPAGGFGEWLRAVLKFRRMSQRQLAQRSGVDHATISRLIRGHRTPTFATATKVARALGELREDNETTRHVWFGPHGATRPGIERALRADPHLSEAQVRKIMGYYLAVREGRTEGVGLAADGEGGGPDVVGPLQKRRTVVDFHPGAAVSVTRISGARGSAGGSRNVPATPMPDRNHRDDLARGSVRG